MDVRSLSDKPLAPANRDHALTGEWTRYRDRHLTPDLVLIYAKPDEATLDLGIGCTSPVSRRARTLTR